MLNIFGVGHYSLPEKYSFVSVILILGHNSIEPQTDVSHVRVHEMKACSYISPPCIHVLPLFIERCHSVCNTLLLTDYFSIDIK